MGFCAIFVYLCISIVYVFTHLLSLKHASLLKTRKVLAWILFPLFLWVHTIVSLDFAVTTNNLWQELISQSILFSGFILWPCSCCFSFRGAKEESSKNRRTINCRFLAPIFFWIWELFQKGVWHFEVVFFVFVIVQLLWIPVLRNQKAIRLFVSFSVLISMWLERYVLIVPSDIEWLPVDYGWFALGIGLFLSVFFGLYLLIQKYNPLVFYVSAEESNEKYSKKSFMGYIGRCCRFCSSLFCLKLPTRYFCSFDELDSCFVPSFLLFAGLSFFALGGFL
jgi:hypothetical protein